VARPPLDVAFTAATKAVRARLAAFALAQFARGQYRDADMEVFLKSVVPAVLASRRQVSALTDSYLSQTLTKQLGHAVRPRGPIDTAALRGVDPATVYSRPFVTVRTKLAEGRAFDSAVQAGSSRLTELVATDMQMAKTYTAQSVLSGTAGVTGYERVTTGANTCALCAIASTQRYSRADLLPIHPGCSCDVVPITAQNPWDAAAAQQRLSDTHAAVLAGAGENDPSGRNAGLAKEITAKGFDVKDYARVLVTHDHGEIGPVLAIRGQHFTGPNAI